MAEKKGGDHTKSGGKYTLSPRLASELDSILKTRGQERSKRILESDHPEQLVQALPPEELFFAMRETDDEAFTELLIHAKGEQVQFLLDLDLWNKDLFIPEKVGSWLAKLSECPRERLAQWLDEVDQGMLSFAFSKLVTIGMGDEETGPPDPGPDRSQFTFDSVHFIVAPTELEPQIRTLFKTIIEENPELFRNLLLDLSVTMDSETEEACFARKQARLAVRGFPDWEESIEIYETFNARSADELPPRVDDPANIEEEESAGVAPRYPLVLYPSSPNLLARSLKLLEESGELEKLRAQLAYLSNKVLVADGHNPGDVDSYYVAARKVAGFVSIGLELVCGPDPAKCAELLKRCWVQHLFSAGWTRIKTASRVAEEFLKSSWPEGKMERLLFLDPPMPQVIDALLRRWPRYRSGDPADEDIRDFISLTEVLEAEKTIAAAEFIGRYLIGLVEFALEDLDRTHSIDTENLRASTVFLTALTNAMAGESFKFAPVPREWVWPALAPVWQDDEPPRRVKPEIVDDAVNWASSRKDISEEEREVMAHFIGFCLTFLEEEFGNISGDEAPDPRFTRGLWLI